jgi:maltose alpha-D-glucosyltransferase/alpha-amylase
MRLNVGIRRRLSALMEHSRPRIELLNGLLLSLPGTPIIYYGDEIGMGDNIYLGDRNGVRTPMQWTADRNAGFSRCDPARLYAPVIMDAVTGYQGINVEAQERSPYSLLNWMRRIVALRQQHRTFGRGTMELVRPANRRVFAFARRLDGDNPILVVANLSRTMQAASFDLSRFAGLVPVEMSGGTELPRITDAPFFLTLGPYGFYWLELKREAPSPVMVRPLTPHGEIAPDQSPLLVGPEWAQLLNGNTRRLLEQRYLEPFLRRQRWFTNRPEPLGAVQLADWGLVRRTAEPFWVTVWLARQADGTEERYAVPLVLVRGERDAAREAPDAIVAPIAGARKGALMAALEAGAARELFDGIANDRTWQMKHGGVVCTRTPAFETLLRLTPDPDLTPSGMRADQSNTSILFGERYILKIVRRLWPGLNPELEIGRFLTEQTQFRNVPRLAGAIEYHDVGGVVSTLAVLHEQVFHRADGWRHALTDLEHYFDRTLTWELPRDRAPSTAEAWTTAPPELAWSTVGGYLKSAAVLGRRTAELHLALNGPAAGETLGVQVLDRASVQATTSVIRAEAAATFEALREARPALPDSVQELARQLIDRRRDVDARLKDMAAAIREPIRTSRIHGDYHLGQVLLGEEDYTIVDFEGEPTRSIEERRRHQSPMKDVAGMLRSFHYAAGAGLIARGATAAPAGLERLGTWARWWQAWTTASFLTSYRETAAGAPFLPSDRGALSALLDVFLIEKALYEIRYELGHRPAWLPIPMRGLLDLLG